jgi:hypothetical protein
MIGTGGGFSAGATGGSVDAVLVQHSHGGITAAQNIANIDLDEREQARKKL